MSGITLEVILSEIKRIELVHAGEFKSIRSEMGEMKAEIHGEIGGIKAEIGEMKTEIGGIKGELKQMNTRLDRVENKIDVIRQQTATVTEQQVNHEFRIRKLEGSAGLSST
jgi:archaellum component FlaC